MFLMLIVAATLQTQPAPSAGQPAGTEGAAKVAESPAADPKKDFICKTEEVTGTRFTKKVCRRKDEVALKEAEERERLRTMQRPQYDCRNLNNGVC